MSQITEAITAKVKLQYECFPYPDYPLLARPRWQEGIAAGSAFCQALANRTRAITGPQPAASGSTLIVGCGDMQPFVLRQIEGSEQKLDCVDLSGQSIRKAKWRMAFLQLTRAKLPNHNTEFFVDSIETFFEKYPRRKYDHIEAYGVLHHLASPSEVIATLASHLNSQGTMRVMVYNRQARKWIRHLKRVFELLQLDPQKPADRKQGRELLQEISRNFPNIAAKLMQMGPSLLAHDGRFVDAFFHGREINYSYQDWIQLFLKHDLKPLGLLDRYAELDHLKNPLWEIPDPKTLSNCLDEGMFDNNFEIYLQKNGAIACNPSRRHYFTAPPLFWFQFQETKNLSFFRRWQIWMNFQAMLNQHQIPTHSLDKIPLQALQRLARIGAILPRATFANAQTPLLADAIDHVPENQEKPEVDCETRTRPTIEAIIKKRELNRPTRRLDLIESHLRAI